MAEAYRELCIGRGVLLRALAGFVLALASTGCGYEPAYGRARSTRFRVAAAPTLVAEPGAAEEALAGARQELAAAGALATSGEGWELRIELLRLDERSTALGASEADAPTSAGTEVALTGRGRVFRPAEDQAAFDTGDVRRAVLVASGSSPTVDAAQHESAVRSAARELGRALARRTLGFPEPSGP